MDVLVIGSIKGDQRVTALNRPFGNLRAFLVCNKLLVTGKLFVLPVYAFLAGIVLNFLLARLGMMAWGWLALEIVMCLIGMLLLLVDPGVDSTSDLCIQS